MKAKLQAIWARAVRDGLDGKAFKRLVQTHVLSSAGDGLVTVALAGSVFFNDDPNTARLRVAFTLILTVAPFAVVAPFLGPAIDRARGGRRLILLSAASCRALLCLLMAGSLDSVALYPVAFLSLVCSKAHAVAKSASVPELVKTESTLVRANSVLAVGAVVAGFVAAIVGFLMSSVGGPQWALRGGAMIFACAAALSLEVGAHSPSAAEANSASSAKQILHSGVWRAAAVMASLRASVGFLAFLIAFDLRRRGAPTAWFGLAITAGMVGSSLGNLIAPRVRGRLREEPMLIASIATLGVCALLFSQRSDRLISSVLALVLGVCAATGKLAFDSLVQRDAPAAMQGRSFARFEAIFQLAWVAAALIPVALTISLAAGFLIMGAFASAMTVWYVIGRRPAAISQA